MTHAMISESFFND